MSSALLIALREQRRTRMKGGIYHRTQVDMAYNSNHIEGSLLTHEQTRLIFDTRTVVSKEALRVDDIIEAQNHFRAFDHLVDTATEPLTEAYIKQLHKLLKKGTADEALDWFRVGDYKALPNEVGGQATTAPEDVAREMATLLAAYHEEAHKTLDDLLDFHCRFERIHPFQDGNGRVGRLILLKECLAHDIVPFIITDSLKLFYYRGLQQWPKVKGYLRDTCLTAQDDYKRLLDYFRIDYRNASPF